MLLVTSVEATLYVYQDGDQKKQTSRIDDLAEGVMAKWTSVTEGVADFSQEGVPWSHGGRGRVHWFQMQSIKKKRRGNSCPSAAHTPELNFKF